MAFPTWRLSKQNQPVTWPRDSDDWRRTPASGERLRRNFLP